MPGKRPLDPCRVHDAETVLRWIARRDAARRLAAYREGVEAARHAARMARRGAP